ncbi:MAG: hypothetical protein ABL933_15805 [Methyloglobulus sp.]
MENEYLKEAPLPGGSPFNGWLREETFWCNAFLSVAGNFVADSRWKKDEKEMVAIEDRAELSAKFADDAVIEAKKRGYFPNAYNV